MTKDKPSLNRCTEGMDLNIIMDDFFHYLYIITDDFDRKGKATLKIQILNTVLEIEKSIIMAINSDKKKSHLYAANTHLEVLKFLITQAFEVKCIGMKRYEKCCKFMWQICPMVQKWINNEQTK